MYGTAGWRTMTPQLAINLGNRQPSECDVVTVILAGRLGSPLPVTMLRPDGSRYRSGTEWEYSNAIEAFERQGRPQVLVYRRTELAPLPAGDPEAADQRRQVEEFFEEFRAPNGSLRRDYITYATPEEFELRYERDLKVLLLHLLDDQARRKPLGLEPQPAPAQAPAPGRGSAAQGSSHAQATGSALHRPGVGSWSRSASFSPSIGS